MWTRRHLVLIGPTKLTYPVCAPSFAGWGGCKRCLSHYAPPRSTARPCTQHTCIPPTHPTHPTLTLLPPSSLTNYLPRHAFLPLSLFTFSPSSSLPPLHPPSASPLTLPQECLIKCSFGCCCYKRDPKGYSTCKKTTPFCFYLLFFLCAGGCATVAITQIGSFSEGLTSLVCDTDRIRVQTSAFMDNLATPMQAIAGNASTVINDVDAALAETTAITSTLTAIIQDLNKFEADAKAMKTIEDEEGNEMKSTVKDNAVAQVAKITVDMNKFQVNVAGKLEGMKSSIGSTLTGVRAGIESAAKGVSDANTMAKKFLDGEFKDVVETLKGYFAPLRYYTYPGAAVALAIVILPFLMVMVGLFFVSCGKYTNCTGVKCIDNADDGLGMCCLGGAEILTFLAMAICLLVGGVSLPTGVVSSDICVVLENLPSELPDYIKLGGSSSTAGGNNSATLGRRRRLVEEQIQFIEDIYGTVIPLLLGGESGRSSMPAAAGGRGGGGTTRTLLSASSSTRLRHGSTLAGGSKVIADRGSQRFSVYEDDGRSATAHPSRRRLMKIDAALMLGTCFKNESLGKALNLTNSFSFATLDFSALDSMNVTGGDNFKEFDR